MITPDRLELENFHSIQHGVYQLGGQGMVLVLGQNGSGKSSICAESIAYILYDISLRYKPQGSLYGDQPGAEVVRDGAKSMAVRLDFTANGSKYSAIRARGHKEWHDGLTLLDASGNDMSKGAKKDTQSMLNRLIGLGPRGFCRSVVFAADLSQFPMLPASKKMEVLNEMMDLGRIDDALVNIRDESKQASTDLQEAEKELAACSQHYEISVEHLNNLVAESDAHLLSQKEALERFEQFKDSDIKTAKAVIKDSKAALKRESESLKSIDDKIVKLEKFCDNARKMIEEQKEKSTITKTNILSEISNLKGESQILSDWMNEANEIGDIQCPTCKQDVNRDHIQSEIEKANRSISTNNAKIEKLRDKFDELQSDQQQITEYQEIVRAKESIVKQLRTTSITHNRNAESLKRDIRDAERDLEEASSRKPVELTDPFTAPITKVNREILETSAELEAMKLNVSRLLKVVGDNDVLQKCFGPKGARMGVMNTVLPLLNAEAKRVKEVMGTSIGLEFRIRGDDETFAGTLETVVTNPSGAPSYRGDSSGERRRADAMVMMSLFSLVSSRGNRSINYACFDESFDTLDEEGRTAMAKLIRGIADDKSTVFVLSHSPSTFSTEADKIWKVSNGVVEIVKD